MKKRGYAKNDDFNGIDTFVLTVTDGLGGIINRFIEITVLPVKDAPVCTTLPLIWGDFYLDNTVVCNPGIWNDDIDNQYAEPGGESHISLFYQWQRATSGIINWENIGDATNSTYVITGDETGHYIKCEVTAVDDGIGVGDDNTTVEDSNFEYCNGPASVDEELILPIGFTSVYPNPFNPSTTISFNLIQNADVELEIYNVKGQLINTLIHAQMGSGSKGIVWNGMNKSGDECPTGFYLAKLKINDQQFVRKLMLMK